MLPLSHFGTVAFIGRWKPPFVEVQAHVLEKVAVDFFLAERAADVAAVHDHAALADVIDLVAILIVFEAVDAGFPPKALDPRPLALGERGPCPVRAGKHPGNAFGFRFQRQDPGRRPFALERPVDPAWRRWRGNRAGRLDDGPWRGRCRFPGS